jgi:isoquinoline 1-oxidoreductase beta subunit
MPIAWHQTNVGQSVLASSVFASQVIRDGIDPSSVEGAAEMPFAVANHRVELHTTTPGVPVLWWRSVGHSHQGFVVSSFLDELAHLARRDPLEMHRALLVDKPRHRRILELVAQRARWGRPSAPGRFHGLALHQSFGSIVAQVAEVSVSGSEVRVHRVTCAVDCGIVVNPLTVEAQIQGAIVFGLSAALHGEIEIRDGQAQAGNFDAYPVLRMNEMPEIDVLLAPGGEPIGGVGEPGLPPIAGAVCNAIFAATGRRIRRLPILASLAAPAAA